MPLGYRRLRERRVKDVKDGDLIAGGNRCLMVDAFDHPVESADLLHQVVCAVEVVDWPVELKVVGEGCARRAEIASLQRPEIAIDDVGSGKCFLHEPTLANRQPLEHVRDTSSLSRDAEAAWRSSLSVNWQSAFALTPV
jgi:hypothetical protein